jgi:hypothetical protein
LKKEGLFALCMIGRDERGGVRFKPLSFKKWDEHKMTIRIIALNTTYSQHGAAGIDADHCEFV